MREYVRLQTAILLRRLAYQVGRAARSGDAETIHDLRVAIRRFSRCLRVFSKYYPGNSWKKIRSRLRELMQCAGTVRDIDIALELMRAAGLEDNAGLASRLKADRQRAHRELLQEIRRWKTRGFSKQWRGRLDLMP